MGKASYNINNGSNDPKGMADNAITNENKPEAGKFRTILPQVLASTAKNLLLLDLGLSAAFPTIVIPALRRTIIDPTHEETLFFTDSQASWFASIAYICQPIGSVLSGWVTEPLGRKKAMIIVNVPHIIAWLLLHFANSLEEMYIGAVLLGLGVGFMEAPIITYVGEICQPSIRGIIISCAGVAVTLGFFIVFLLGSVTDWRTAALACLAVPLITVVAICFVPETPMWLLGKSRREEALKSLQWLRGWVSPKAVEKEFLEMERYSQQSTRCTACQKANIDCVHPPPTMAEKIKELIRKRTLKAFFLVSGLFFFGQFTGLHAMRPFLVQIFKAFKIPVDPNWVTVVFGIIGLMANIVCMSTIKLIGKRKICLIGYCGSLTTCIALASYAENVFPPNYNSFDIKGDENIETSYFPMVAYMFFAFFAYGGVTSVPWMLLSEVFPFKTRGLATGITAGLNYILGFIATKTYLNLDKGLSLKGAMWFYSCVNILGLLFVYLLVPETENRTLEDIEIHFSENNLKMTDIKIKKQCSYDKAIEGGSINDKNCLPSTTKNNATSVRNVNDKGCDNKGYE